MRNSPFKDLFHPLYNAGRRHVQKLSAYRRIFPLLSLITLTLPAAAQPETSKDASLDHQDAAILIYHRFGENDVPSTNVRLDQFEEQLAILREDGRTVLALGEILDAFAVGRPLPEKAIAITVDDAYASFAENAWPRLKRAGIPVTLFVATDPVDQGLSRTLSWDQIRALAEEGVLIGHHGAGHIHMVDEGIQAAKEDILRANARFEAELGFVPTVFAYPYGEYSPELAQLVEKLGFKAAFAQYSGVAAAGKRRFALPRFAINETYADPDRFRLITQAKALPVQRRYPSSPVVTKENNPPAFGFYLPGDMNGASRLGCFASHQPEPLPVTVMEDGHARIRIADAFPRGRQRINCTMPAGDGRWYWLGQLFYVPPAID